MSEHVVARLRARIPRFECNPGCSDCCGPFLWNEWQAAEDERGLEYDQLKCEHLSQGKCEIYEDRPILCRLFGASEHEAFTCPHGCGPAITLTRSETMDILNQWIELVS